VSHSLNLISLTEPSNCRQDWSILRPLITSDSEYLDDLLSTGVFIAGTTDSTLVTRSLSESDDKEASTNALFDVIYYESDRRIVITERSKNDMKMNSIHRDLASVFTELESNPDQTDQDILKAVALKTDKILKHLKAIAEDSEGGQLTEQAINENIPNENTQQWLYRVAIAEGML
jgi:hypothetical protein